MLAQETILVVDDDPRIARSLKVALEDFWFATASGGPEALELLKAPNDVALVVLDVWLKGSTGTDVLLKIKALRPDLPVILVSGLGSRDVLIKALRGGADDYLDKPLNPVLLRQKINALLDRRPLAGHSTSAAGEDQNVNHVIRFLDRNYDKQVGLKDAASLVSLNPKYLSRVFKSRTGRKFTEYRLSVRMRWARKLLDDGLLSVGEIALKLGYENVESFLKMFKKVCGRTPSEYRARKPVLQRKSGRPPSHD